MRTVNELSESERKEYYSHLLMAKFCESADEEWLDRVTNLPVRDVFPKEYRDKAYAILSKEP